MRKTIKGNSITCYRGTVEHLDDYIELFKIYFKNIAHHYHMHHSINKNAILIYSYFPMEISCSGCPRHGIEFKIDKISTNTIPVTFYETKHRDLICSGVDKILYDNICVGYYCRKNNVFCCGDIAHEPNQAVHIKAILTGMEKGGFISPLKKDGNRVSVTLGTDPEMEVMVNGELVSALDCLQLSTRDKVYLSHDGHTQPQRELRPDPANSPEELVENIRDLIKISSFFNEELSVLGNRLPLGGHIHIGNATPSLELTSVLDYFLSPFRIFNSPERMGSKYGKPGDVRAQPHGFEYRTPPAAWLLTPTLARMTLELTQIIVEKIINDENVEISDNFDIEEYKGNLNLVGFHESWITQFLNEIEWAKANISTPLAKTWGVEIPVEYRSIRSYKNKYPPTFTPRPIRQVDFMESIEIDCEDPER